MVPAEYHIVVVGARAVGKSELVLRFATGSFAARTKGIKEHSYLKHVEIDSRPRILDIMDDTLGSQEEYGVLQFAAIRDLYMKNGDGFVLAYSVTSQKSFVQVVKLRGDILRLHEEQKQLMPFVLVATKCDLDTERVVSTDDGRSMAENWGVGFFETSAKTEKNVSAPFFELVRLIDKWREANPKHKVIVKHNSQKPSCVLL